THSQYLTQEEAVDLLFKEEKEKEKEREESKEKCNKICILELGTGVGVVGLACLLAGVSKIILTDRDTEILKVCVSNIQRNAKSIKDVLEQKQGCVKEKEREIQSKLKMKGREGFNIEKEIESKRESGEKSKREKEREKKEIEEIEWNEAKDIEKER